MSIFIRFKWVWFLLTVTIALPVFAASGSFSVTPAKQELSLNPGQSIIKNLTIVNNLGHSADFNLSLQDLSGGSSPNTGVQLLSTGNSPYSLSHYLTLPISHLSLLAGESKDIPIAISLPANAPPGALYSALTVAVSSVTNGDAKVTARLSSLWFVRIIGPVKASGQLISFSQLGSWWSKQLHFQFTFKNDGNNYLNPYGGIELSPILGWGRWRAIVVEPNFILPDSTRIREVIAPANGFCGFYRATLKLNRGYDNIIDQRSKVLVVCYPNLGFSLLAGVLLFGLLVWLMLKLRQSKRANKLNHEKNF